MTRLSEQDRKKLIELIEAGKPLPPVWKSKLFESDDAELVEATKVYQLVYAGKTPKQAVIGNTPSAPFQEVRRFNEDNPSPGGWRNLLIYGDNLLALKTLYDDQRGPNRYGTKNKIKLIYIDPPFATKQDFMKDREKAYRDKVIGAQFIEFLRKRLILLREILADDGSIFVHLDTKKGHYIKAVMDEIFGEFNFQNELIWKRTPFAGSSKARSSHFPVNHDTIFFYTKSADYLFEHQYVEYSEDYKARFKYKDDRGWYRKTLLKTYSKETENRLRAEGRFIAPEKPGAYPSYKQYLHESKGKQIEDIWDDLNLANPMAAERLGYPTQKPEVLLGRVIAATTRPDDITLDAFAGSGTTLAVAEKLGRRWIGMDCGKLAVYTTQRRLLELTSSVGSLISDDRLPHERVSDFAEHAKTPAQGLLMISEKTKKGEVEVTDEFLRDLAAFVKKYVGKKNRELSLVCPRERLVLRDVKADDPGEDDKAGEQVVEVEGVRFLISFIEPKEKAEKEQPLKAKEFVLLNAGVYDNDKIKGMPWQEYKPFVMRLFGVREAPHKIHSFTADGYIGTDSAFVWDYPNRKKLILDEEYVESLHKALGGRAGDRFYVIAPVVSMGFMMDEIPHGDTTYVFLKVPISILLRLLESEEHGAIKQPISEADVNEVIDAVGFDFVSQPVVKVQCKRMKPDKEDLLNRHQRDYVIRLKEFRAHTLATDPEDFGNFETLSMILVDTDFKGDVFRLGKVIWADDLVKAELARQDVPTPGTFAEQAALCKQLDARVPEADFTGKKLMAIFIDKYGNEKKELYTKADFT